MAGILRGAFLVMGALALFVVACRNIAESKGYSPAVGLIGVTGVFGLLILMTLPEKPLRPAPGSRDAVRRR